MQDYRPPDAPELSEGARPGSASYQTMLALEMLLPKKPYPNLSVKGYKAIEESKR
jgi:hypothetical protein